ncbi:MAG TPA: porin family protein [Ohtaekwangia sp.]|uniref:porin family protein n=1 Tax=Ohtaekwangia sp. TaxID=2066019 RepID=UPI002F947559
MKKIFTLLLIVSPLLLQAQLYIGAKAGATLSNYKTKTPWKEVANLGFSFGATSFKQLNTNFGLQVDLQYTQKGYYHKVCNTITDQLKANYIEIPIMVDYGFIIPSLDNFKAHVTLGIYTAYWLSGKYKMEGFDQSSENFDFSKSNASRFDIGPNAGGRLEYILKNGSVSLDFRYEMGLLDLQKRINDNTRNTNHALLVSLSYLMPIGN